MMTINAAKKILEDFYEDYREVVEDNAYLSQSEILKVLNPILDEYAMKIITELGVVHTDECSVCAPIESNTKD